MPEHMIDLPLQTRAASLVPGTAVMPKACIRMAPRLARWNWCGPPEPRFVTATG
ncbi:MAG: hypothetical protein H7840_17250 [Alphaproteobacteria bacterium]